MKDHINAKHTQAQTYKCPHCDYTTLRKSGIREHDYFIHKRKNKRCCPYCQKEYNRKSLYDNHIKICDLKSEKML